MMYEERLKLHGEVVNTIFAGKTELLDYYKGRAIFRLADGKKMAVSISFAREDYDAEKEIAEKRERDSKIKMLKEERRKKG